MNPLKIIERVGRASRSGFHSAFVTSFATEFAAFEELLLPQLMAVGCRNVALIADTRMTSLALSDGSILPRQLGRAYSLYGPPIDRGVFHPKIILQLGRDRGRAFISSANVTGAGLAGNVEIGTEIEWAGDDERGRTLIEHIANYINDRVVQPGPARDALDWAAQRTPWLSIGAPPPSHRSPDDDHIAFLAAPGPASILGRFCEQIEEPVERLVVASPYWDDSLTALSELCDALQPRRAILLIDGANHEFPANAELPAAVEIVDIARWRPNRFNHAKLIVAQTSRLDHVLSGSANCTHAALGRRNALGANAEASLYRRLPKGRAIDQLGLGSWLEAIPTDRADLPPRTDAPALDLAHIAAARPGRFLIENGRLVWRPAHPFSWASAVIELLDMELGVLMKIVVDGDPGEVEVFAVDDAIASLARFARIRHTAGASALAGIDQLALLKRTRREPLSGSGVRAADWFSNAVDLQLFALEALDELCRADRQSDETPAITPNRLRDRTPSPDLDLPRTLAYEQFMAERADDRTRGTVSDSLLDGTHCDHVRALLNRLSAIADGIDAPDEPDSGEDLDVDPVREGLVRPAAADPLDPTIDEPVDAKAFERAVDAYCRAVIETGMRGAQDVLRLRLWIMLLLYNARCDALRGGLAPTIDDDGWPRLMFRVLVAFFSGRAAPMTRLVVERADGALPRDYAETWATVLWGLDAIERFTPKTSAGNAFAPFLIRLRTQVVAALRLDAGDLENPELKDRWAGLDAQLESRLQSARQMDEA